MAQKLATLVVALVFAVSVGNSSATWCVCKPGLNETVLQKSIDYACGNGADCTIIHQGGACYNPNTVPGHCNYAVNSFFQKKGQAPSSCDFAGAAIISTSDPSVAGCVYPPSASAAATTTNTPKSSSSSSSGSMTPVGGGSPYMATPSNGGVNSLGPSGVGINTDDSAAGQQKRSTATIITAGGIVFLGNLFLWGII